MFGIRRSAVGMAVTGALVGLSVFGAATVHAQTPRAAGSGAPPEHHRCRRTGARSRTLDLEVVRLNPQLQDVSVSLARSAWAPTFTTFAQGSNRDTPINSLLAGDVDKLGEQLHRHELRAAVGTPVARRQLPDRLGEQPRHHEQRVRELHAADWLQPHVQLHAAAAAQLRHRQHAPAAAGLAQEPRDLRRAGARGRRHDHPLGEERLLGSGVRAQQPRGAAPVARPRPAVAQGEPRPRRDRHDGADRHRAGGSRSGAARGSGDPRRSGHRPRRRRAARPHLRPARARAVERASRAHRPGGLRPGGGGHRRRGERRARLAHRPAAGPEDHRSQRRHDPPAAQPGAARPQRLGRLRRHGHRRHADHSWPRLPR